MLYIHDMGEVGSRSAEVSVMGTGTGSRLVFLE